MLADDLGYSIVGDPIGQPYVNPYLYVQNDGRYFVWSDQFPVDQSYHPGGHLAGNVLQKTTRGQFEWEKEINRNWFTFECRSDTQINCPQTYYLADDGTAILTDRR